MFSRRLVTSLVVTLSAIPSTTSFGFRLPLCYRFISTSSLPMSQEHQQDTDYFRSDGVRITHDPFAPGLAEKYGLPGQTDPEGFVGRRSTDYASLALCGLIFSTIVMLLFSLGTGSLRGHGRSWYLRRFCPTRRRRQCHYWQAVSESQSSTRTRL